MLLVIDVGNSHTVLGIYDDEILVHDFRIETSRNRTVDEYHVLFSNLLEIASIQISEITSAIMASVVPPLNETISEAVDRAFDQTLLVVGPGIKTGISIQYENPKEVGADRIVNAVAAYDWAKQSVIVVDFGTATTFDCISEDGQYLGGAISPGIAISADALFSRAAKLPRIEIVKPPKVIGKNTVESMQSGIVYGYTALVDGLVERIQQELSSPAKVIATGGLSSLIQPESKTIEIVDENLTLEGLRLIHSLNS